MNLMNEVDLVYRSRTTASPVIKTSNDAYHAVLPAYQDQLETRELAVVLYLDGAGRCRGIYRVSSGGLHGTVVDPKLVFCAALMTLATSVIISHNHPSGQLRPSKEDLAMTQRLVGGAGLLDLKLMDHLIITAAGFYSFRDNGLL